MGTAALVAGYLKRFGALPRMASGGAIPPSVTFPSSRLATRVYIALGADLTASYLTWNWLDITQRVRHDLGITITVGRGDERGQVTPSRCQIKIDNNDGAFCRHNPYSPYYGQLSLNTPIWIQLDPGSGFVDRYFGFINEWPTTWADESGTDAFVTIQCTGVMGRLARGQALRSPVYRSISGYTPGSLRPIAYWPMEDGSNSTQFASAIPGVNGTTPVGTVSYAASSDLPGSGALPTFASGTTVTHIVPPSAITNAWVVQFVVRVASDPVTNTVLASIITGGGGGIVQYDVLLSPSGATLELNGYDASGVRQLHATLLLDGSGPANPTPANFYGKTWSIRIAEKYDASVANIFGFLFLADSDSETTAQAVDSSATTPSAVSAVKLWSYAATNGIAFGHVAVHTDASLLAVGAVTTEILNTIGALNGWTSEQAHARILRLCQEEGITARALAATSAPMGAQGSGTLLAELRACEAADQGFLFEEQFGVAFQALSARYNASVTFEMDFNSGHIAGVPIPADNVQRLVNRFTATRPGGSSATAEQRDGPLSTTKSGVFEGSATVTVETDDQLAHYAGWKVRLGTVDEVRWPQLAIRLHRTPDLIPGWLTTPLGSRINVANPPSPIPSTAIDAVLEGYSERWDQVFWVATLTTSPASPYDVGELDGTDTRVDSGTSTLAAAVTASDSSMSVATSDSRDLWTTSGADYPQDVTIAGIHVTVTAVSGASSPQTFTVTGATVTKDLNAGEEVHVRYPLILAL